MLSNYLKIALRHLRRHKGYSFLNILGLAIGMACTILIMLWSRDELSYDRFHVRSDRLYRVTREWFNQDGVSNLHLARVAPPVAPLLKNDFPAIIEDVVRVCADYRSVLTVGDRTFVESGLFWAEPNFLGMFSYPLLKGDPTTVLRDPNSVVLSEATARRYFGNEDPMGKTIRYENARDLKVTGIAGVAPGNSHFTFDLLGSFATLTSLVPQEFSSPNWGSNNYLTYILLRQGVVPQQLQDQIPDFLDRHLTPLITSQTGSPPLNKPSKTTTLHLQKLTDIHLYSHLTSELEENGDITNVYLFSGIAVAILLIACINFMNLATARSAKRAREIGMRKVLGAYRTQLVKQFMGESTLLACIALVFATVLVEGLLPAFNVLTGKHLSLDVLHHPDLLAGLLLIALLVGLISGSYPALVLSSLKPVRVLKGEKVSSRHSIFRTMLVVGQFAVSIALIISMGTVRRQIDFLRNKELGFNKEHVVILPSSPEMRKDLQGVRARLAQNPNVLNVTASRLVPSNKLLNSAGGQILEGEHTVPLTFRLALEEVNYDFFETYEIPFLAGRGFSRSFPTDDSAAFVLNRTAVQRLGWGVDAAVGKRMLYGGRRGMVVGVVEDINFESLHNGIVPMIYVINAEGSDQVAVRLSGKDTPGSLALLRKVWAGYLPGVPFEFSSLDENLDALYKKEDKMGEVFAAFSSLAIIIACLGLYGLASYAVQQRTKEMGIRKVLGATIAGLTRLISAEFVRLVLIANVIAWPIAYYAMNVWLSGFAYHAPISIMVFIEAGLLAAIIALLTVGYQSVRASLGNPVEALRYE